MKSDVLVIGAGASGLMAAYSAARSAVDAGVDVSVTILEKMPRPGRKIMITGKGRCNFTNVKPWNEFSAHIRTNPNFVKSSFHCLPGEAVVDFFEKVGMRTVVERGDRAFPASYHASEVVDTLVRACHGVGVKIETGCEVQDVERTESGFSVGCADGRKFTSRFLVVATGGLSYPSTGSTGDGYRWASGLGHSIEATFPSLTALVPQGYKTVEGGGLHIHRDTPLSSWGEKLCGVQLKNVQAELLVEGTVAGCEFGDLDFTDGGIEGPIGFQLSRKAVKSLINGSRVTLVLDLKAGVDENEFLNRVRTLWKENAGLRFILGKLLPRELVPAFCESFPKIKSAEALASALRAWKFPISGYVGYERAVVTAGGVSTSEVMSKTMESKLVPGLYFCGEVLDMDSDTGGYNLQTAFCTGALAGRSILLKSQSLTLKTI